MKEILVVDVNMTQDNKHICEDDKQRCPLWNKDMKFCMYNFNNNTKGCPLKPMPKELEPAISEKYVDYCQGFNDCIDEILGDKE